MRTALCGRYYLLRFVYGSILLFLVWSGYQETFWNRTTATTIAAVAGYSERTFVTFAVVQLITILLLIPAIFGGAIVDEKQRKTLHYLMASQLYGPDRAGQGPGPAAAPGGLPGDGLPIVSILGPDRGNLA